MFQVVIGPATVGGIQAGAFKIGDTAGTIDNIIACKLYRPGSVGFVSKSVCIHSIAPLSFLTCLSIKPEVSFGHYTCMTWNLSSMKELLYQKWKE